MVERLRPEEQRVVDESWLNMLSPPERLDRWRLLDVLVVGSFYEHGVDRLSFVSEKDVWGGRVVTSVYFDRRGRRLTSSAWCLRMRRAGSAA